ncbi:PREDICTED: probable apyrase 4 [Camelina sativa]|uniref:apyrase n=1 Tax=Camelina sativa TaxID=90675 RepID=A0ABM0WUR6_CAMSA|nr:PREDICTED: probable apyrase 4 [Camelina sativa]
MQRPSARSRLKFKSDMIDPPEVETSPGHNHRSSPSTLAKPKSKRTKSIILLIVASVAIALGLLFVCFSIVRSRRNQRVSLLKYSVVIDGGSSGTRVHVFGYRVESGKPVFDFGEESYASFKLSPGLSAYGDNPEGVSESVTELVEFAKRRVPKRVLEESDIRLMATAGMRLLELSVQEWILEVTRRVLRSSGFSFREEWASVISGSDEGIYAWVVANHALGLLGGEPLKTTGIVELGGASAQVTFVSSELVPLEFSRTLAYGNVSYNLYSHSFLHFGQDSAQEKLLDSLQNSSANSAGKGRVTDPCVPRGYTLEKSSQKDSSGFLAEKRFTASLQAAGNFSKCRSATLAMLQEGKEKCPYKHCSIGSIFTPNLRGSFLATENFFHTSKFFGLGEKHWLSELILAGKRYCGEEWSKLKVKYPTFKDENLLRYCFSSAYIVSMLHDSLGIALDDERIGFASKAGQDIPLDWALGAFILNTATSTFDYNGKSRKILDSSNLARYKNDIS